MFPLYNYIMYKDGGYTDGATKSSPFSIKFVENH